MFGRRDRLRTCTKCGEVWRVPARLVRPKRASRWQRGGTGADSHALGGATPLFDVAIDQWKENVNRGNEAADAADFAVAVFDTCPNCGAATWTERKASRQDRAVAG